METYYEVAEFENRQESLTNCGLRISNNNLGMNKSNVLMESKNNVGIGVRWNMLDCIYDQSPLRFEK